MSALELNAKTAFELVKSTADWLTLFTGVELELLELFDDDESLLVKIGLISRKASLLRD